MQSVSSAMLVAFLMPPGLSPAISSPQRQTVPPPLSATLSQPPPSHPNSNPHSRADHSPQRRSRRSNASVPNHYPTQLEAEDNLRLALAAAVAAEDYAQAASLRDALEALTVHTAACAAKPRFAPGLVVACCPPSPFRAVILGVGVGGAGTVVDDGVSYRVAVDVEDRARLEMRGGNVRVVPQDAMIPVAVGDMGGEGVRHPVVGSVFQEGVAVSDDGFLFYLRR